MTHAGQFESGDLGFNFNGGTYAQDIYDEVAAYQAQAYFNGFNHKEITPKFVQSLTDSDGNKIYEPNGSIRTAPISIRIDTPFYKVCKAYGVSIDEYKLLPFYRAKVMYFKPQR